MAIDSKYGRVTTERGTLGEDEQVVVFRAQDRLLPKLLKVYRYFCELAGSPAHHLEMIDEAAMAVKAWQAENHTQIPRSDSHR
jgi:transposase-like protein